MGFHGVSWDFMRFNGISCDLVGFHTIFWSWMGPNDFETTISCDITPPCRARPMPGRKFRNKDTAIGNQWPIGEFLRCRSNEVLKLWGASTSEQIEHMVVEMPMRWKNPCTAHWINQWVKDSPHQWISGSMKQQINKWMNQWITESMNQWFNKSMNQWNNEATNQWISESMVQRPVNQWTRFWACFWGNNFGGSPPSTLGDPWAFYEGLYWPLGSGHVVALNRFVPLVCINPHQPAVVRIIEPMNQWIGESMNQWFSDSVSQWVSEWLNQWVNESLHKCMNERMTEWTDDRAWLSDWLADWMNEWSHEWMNDWLNEWMNGWMNEWSKWMNDCMHAWKKERMNEWVNEWMDGWIGWMNEWINEFCQPHPPKVPPSPQSFAILKCKSNSRYSQLHLSRVFPRERLSEGFF